MKGKSRRFAFIGFRSEEQANEAVKYFHNTFLLTNRIHVESAARVGDETVLQKSRSKYSLAKVRKLERGKGMEREEANEWKKKQLEASLSLSKRPIDKKKLDFLEAMKARRNAKFWGNDEGMNLPVEPTTEEEENSNRPLRSTTSTKENGNEVTTDDDEDSGAESEKTSANLEEEEEEEQKEEKEKEEDVKMDAMSDMDFLRSKIKTSAVKAEAAQESESQLDCPQNSDREMRGKKKVRAEVNKESGSFPVKGSHFEEKEKEEEQGEEEEEEADRLFVRNLPFLCTEDDLRALLMPLGPLAAVHIPLSDAKQYRGFGYVHFMLPEDADKAIDSLHGTSFQGRVLYITKAKKAPQPSTSSEGAAGGSKGKLSSYQQAKEDQRRKLLGKKDGWVQILCAY